MRKAFSERVERARERGGAWATAPGDDFGRFLLRTHAGVSLLCLLGSGTSEVPWEHVSVSCPRVRRCPTWDEMSWVKSLFFDDEECVVQFHPRKSQYVNQHPYCLHLWKSVAVAFPEPPRVAV